MYARTTQPQTIMHLETSTNIYGVTTNPWNTDLTCGGSSGGDIGGSIRCPAANTGIYGFKPTPGRIGKLGSRAAVLGQEGYISLIREKGLANEVKDYSYSRTDGFLSLWNQLIHGNTSQL
jgi:Asp-tRNA(Asn)/Glu-tRNA(Gln) amidotransferase A subunit family amidase